MNRKLEVGDVLYNANAGVNQFNSRPYKKITIERVTNTQASGSGVRLQREQKWGEGYSQIGEYGTWYLPNEYSEAQYLEHSAEIKENKRIENILYELRNMRWSELSIDQRNRIYSIVKETKTN